MLPRGLLREPAASLARADAVCSRGPMPFRQLAETKSCAAVARLVPMQSGSNWSIALPCSCNTAAARRCRSRPLRGKKVAAFCGIGDPAGFRHTLASCGRRWSPCAEFADHFAYPAAEIESLQQWIGTEAGQATAVVCTHKDLVKIPREQLAGKPLWAVQIAAAIRVGEAGSRSGCRSSWKVPLSLRLQEPLRGPATNRSANRSGSAGSPLPAD